MAFYTCVNRYGNSILYRGYSSDGRPVIKKEKFEPILFVPTNVQDSEWKALDGSNVEPMHFPSMREAQEFVKTYEGVDNFEVHGNTNYVAQYIQEKFPNDIHFDMKMLNVGYIDIEVLSEEGFPEPDKAAYPIVSIAYKSSKANHFRVWTLADFDPVNMELDLNGRIVKYMKFNSEEELLDNFLIWWTENSPDVVTGWNSRLFDIPYIINRTMRILGEKEAKRMSPWKVIRYREIKMKFSSMDAYEIYGVQQMDYMDLFKKFGHAYGIPENHALDTIATLVLDEKKLSYDEYGSLHELYKQNPQKYIEYNIRDVDLVEKINDDSHLLELAMMIAFKGGVNFSDAFGTTGIWDSFIYRHLTPKKIAIPFGEFKRKTEYPGGYVKDVIPGMKDWVVSFDLASLYPNIIVQYNMSPETLVRGIVEPNGVDHFLENAPDEKDYAVAANGVRFRKDKRGMMPEIIVGLYAERRKIKDEMLRLKGESEKTGDESLKQEIRRLDNSQYAIKILMNSLYGAMGSAYFRYFDLRIAEAVTLSGQLTIRTAEVALNRYLNKILKTDKDYVIAIDTDSLYVDMRGLVDAVNPDDPLAFLDKSCKKAIEPVFEKVYNDLFKRMNAYENRMVLEREVIADRGVWTAKKRYILNVLDDEGVRYTEPEIKIKGLEAVKSSTPTFIRDKMKEAFKVILREKEADLQKFVKKTFEEFSKLPAEDVSFPRGVSEVEKWKDPTTVYKKGTPIHVRGSLMYNKLLMENNLHTRFEYIKDGDKIKFCYLKMPNPTRENVISFPRFLPREFGLDEYIDYELQYSKTFREPLKLITNAIDWHLDKTATLKHLFKN